jgi:hypothetical protein
MDDVVLRLSERVDKDCTRIVSVSGEEDDGSWSIDGVNATAVVPVGTVVGDRKSVRVPEIRSDCERNRGEDVAEHEGNSVGESVEKDHVLVVEPVLEGEEDGETDGVAVPKNV